MTSKIIDNAAPIPVLPIVTIASYAKLDNKLSFGPPNIIGTRNVLAASAKAIELPANTPGNVNGTVTCQNVRTRDAPNIVEASRKAGCNVFIELYIFNTINGKTK